MASWKTLGVMNTSLIKKWVYFVYYDLHVCVLVFVCIFMVVANKLKISTLAEGRM